MIRGIVGPARRPALLAALVAGLAIGLYLSWVRLTGGLPACGALAGCEAVAVSEYSAVGGMPVAYLGAGFSAVLLGLGFGWVRWRDPRLIWAAYGLATLGVVVVAYLTYLEIVVIQAVCVWCAGYALAVVLAWLLALEARALGSG